MSENILIPDIRFSGFEKEWKEDDLGNVTESYNSKRVPIESRLRKNGKYPYYGATGIVDYVNDYIFNGEYVLLAEDGENIVSRNANISYITCGKFWVNNHAHVMRIIDGSNYFLMSFLESINYEHLNTGTAQPKLNANTIKSLEVIFPNSAEQHKIGNYFKNLDNNIRLKNKELSNLKNYKQAMLQKMFPKEGETVPEVRFEGFEGEWREELVKDIYTITRGEVLATNKIKKTPDSIYKYPVYSSQTKKDGFMGYYNDYIFENAITWTTDGANAGTVSYRQGKFYSTNVNGVLLNTDGFVNKAMAENINNIAWKHVVRAGNPKLMNNIMGNIRIKYPSLEEQKEISNFFLILDDNINNKQAELDKLKQFKQAMLDKMFV